MRQASKPIMVLTIIILLTLVAASACSKSLGSVRSSSDPDEDFLTGHDFFQKGELDRSRERLEDYLDAKPRGLYAPEALLLLGNISLYMQDYRDAVTLLSKVELNFPDSTHVAEAKRLARIAEVELQKNKSEISDAETGRTKEKKNASTKASKQPEYSKLSLGLSYDAFDKALEHWRTSPEKTSEEKLIDAIDRLNMAELERALAACGTDTLPRGMVMMRSARLHLHQANFDEAEKLLQSMLDLSPDHPFAKQSHKTLKNIEARKHANPNKIGILLPLSGHYKTFGNKIKQAMELAAAEASAARPDGLSFVYADSKGDPVSVVAAVEKLVLKDRVIGIIGPLLGDAAETAALCAEKFGVPMISLSNRDNIVKLGKYIFRSGVTFKMQAKAVSDYAWDMLGARNFAILYPTNPYGEDLAFAFWDEVKKRGGKITGVEQYASGNTTFKGQIRRLVWRYKLSFSHEAQRKPHDTIGLTAGSVRTFLDVDKCKDRMKKGIVLDHCFPTPDFDALFIPDHAKTIGMIAPAIPYEEVEIDNKRKSTYRRVERNRRRIGRELKMIHLLGGSGWNQPYLSRFGGKWVEGSTFCDGFWPGEQADQNAARFVKTFTKDYNRTPDSLDAYAYDAIGLLSHVLDVKRPNNRTALRTALLNLPRYEGATGAMRFDIGGEMINELVILTVKDEEIVPAPNRLNELPSKEIPDSDLYETPENEG